MERTNGTVIFTPEYVAAIGQDRWVAACGGREVEFLHHGIRWLYVYNHAQDAHGYLNLGTDIVQENAPYTEARTLSGWNKS